MAAGLDSLGSVEFANVLGQKLGLQMPGTLVFDYPSAAFVVDHLTAQMLKAAAAAAGSALDAADEEATELVLASPTAAALAPGNWAPRHRALAVLAVSARPLLAGDTDAAAAACGAVGDAIQSIPLERWDLDRAEALQGDALILSAQFGAFMQGVNLFDAAAHGLSAAEAAAMDPQHRMVLEAAAEALAAGGPAVATLAARTGVFVGISWTEYARLAADAGAGELEAGCWTCTDEPAACQVSHHAPLPLLPAAAVTAYTAQGAVLSVCPGRVAYHHALKGPAVAVDTACSSSLVAMHSGAAPGFGPALLLICRFCTASASTLTSLPHLPPPQTCSPRVGAGLWRCRPRWRHQHDAVSCHHFHV